MKLPIAYIAKRDEFSAARLSSRSCMNVSV
jgi:hypothetical protein